jgi:uncharacterized protein UPF0175
VTRIPIDCPDELMDGQSPAALADLAQQAFMVRLYQLGRISSGRAAEVLHTSRREFLDVLCEYGVSPFDAEMDVEAEAHRGR